MKKKRGQHGPWRRRQRVERAISRRLGKNHDDPAWAEAIAKARQDRVAARKSRRQSEEEWREWAYVYYANLFIIKRLPLEAFSAAISLPDGRRLLLRIPEELQGGPRRPHRLPWNEVATWAYRHRRLGQTYAEIAREELDRLKEAHEHSIQAAKDARAKAEKARKAWNSEEEAYQEARAEFAGQTGKDPCERDWAENIMRAVWRHRRIWELAESSLRELL